MVPSVRVLSGSPPGSMSFSTAPWALTRCCWLCRLGSCWSWLVRRLCCFLANTCPPFVPGCGWLARWKTPAGGGNERLRDLPAIGKNVRGGSAAPGVREIAQRTPAVSSRLVRSPLGRPVAGDIDAGRGPDSRSATNSYVSNEIRLTDGGGGAQTPTDREAPSLGQWQHSLSN